MDHSRDEEEEAMLGEIIAQGSDVIASFLRDTDGLEGPGEEEGYVHDDLEGPIEEEGVHEDLEGPGEEEGVHDGSVDRTESDQVYIYILVKPVLTS